MRWARDGRVLAAMLGAGTATAAKRKPPRLRTTASRGRSGGTTRCSSRPRTARRCGASCSGRGTSSRGVVIAHEGAGGLCNWLPYGRRLARLGYRALVFDLRGFVSSPRTRQRQGRHDLDVVGAARELRRRGVQRVALVGGSLGAMAVSRQRRRSRRRSTGSSSPPPGLVFRDLDAGGPHRGSACRRSSSCRRRTASSRLDAYDLRARRSTDKRLVLVPGTRHGYELVLSGDVASNRALFEEFLAKHLTR